MSVINIHVGNGCVPKKTV